ncbi:hypothetical protein [Amycolatopsis cihanbeyliensis]|uniref:hypothetical protein n=1 Tax=Amycolatopsis cihanbeyliensis TaxID=1128664 RepID=UPI001154CBC5|nr:hypothetical protein [Amycolatopsis cihanbeyliensis]
MRDDNISARILGAAFPEIESEDPVAYFSRVAYPYHALCYSWLFWPNLISFHGAVFVAVEEHWHEFVSDRLSAPVSGVDIESPPLSWSQAVRSFNIFEVSSFFRQWPESFENTQEALEQLAHTLVETWSAKLLMFYPDRKFSVKLIDSDPSLELGIEVTQESPELKTPSGWDPQRRFIASREQS